MPQCRICQAPENSQFIRAKDVFGGFNKHKFWECRVCKAIYLYPTLTPEEEKIFYLDEFESYMESRVGDHRDWSNADRHKVTNQDQIIRRMPFLEDFLVPKMDLLEIGCSSGFMLDAFREREINCCGVEPSGLFGKYLEDSGYEVFSDLSEIKKEKKFDLIVHFFVFEHIRDPRAFLKSSMSLLKDRGAIVCEMPCANDPLTSLYDIEVFEKFYWSIAHHFYYTPGSLSYLLDDLGYKYELVPEQRYDISNHIVWMTEGRPGGQDRFTEQFGDSLVKSYKQRLIETWNCDTIFLYIWK